MKHALALLMIAIFTSTLTSAAACMARCGAQPCRQSPAKSPAAPCHRRQPAGPGTHPSACAHSDILVRARADDAGSSVTAAAAVPVPAPAPPAGIDFGSSTRCEWHPERPPGFPGLRISTVLRI